MPNNPKDTTTLGSLLEAKARDNGQLQELGINIGRLYTDHGLPIDMALDRLDLTKQQKIGVLDGACRWLITHKRNSGATEKSIERQRQANKKMVENFIKSNEVGVY